MTDREEMRRLIDLIQSSAQSDRLEQVANDLKMFTDTASYLAYKLHQRLNTREAKPKSSQAAVQASPPIRSSKPKQVGARMPSTQTPATRSTISSALSQTDFDRLKPKPPQPPQTALSSGTSI